MPEEASAESFGATSSRHGGLRLDEGALDRAAEVGATPPIAAQRGRDRTAPRDSSRVKTKISAAAGIMGNFSPTLTVRVS